MMIKELSDLHIPEHFMKKLIKDMDYLLGYEALDIEEVLVETQKILVSNESRELFEYCQNQVEK